MNRGEIVLVDFPFSDRTGSKLRPTLVVQADFLNASIDDTVLALITRTRRHLPTEVAIDPAEAGIRHASVIDCKNLLTVDSKFVHTTIGSLSTSTMERVDAALRVALGLT
jgi:mRNA interferase MazF